MTGEAMSRAAVLAEPVPSVAQALSSVMEAVQSISKDRRVTEGPARFSFRGVDDVMSAVGPVLRTHGVIFAPSRVVSVEHERYLTGNNKPMHGVTVVVEYTITGPAGDTMTAAAAGQAADSGDKAVPKAMSVAYRTVLLQALCIPTDDPDPDSQVHERATDPCIALRKVIAELGTERGWSLTDTGADFYTWSTGVDIREADEALLQKYVDYLRTAVIA